MLNPARYRDDEGNWHDATSYGRDDLPLLCKVSDQVHTWIFEQAKKTAAESNEPQSEEVDF